MVGQPGVGRGAEMSSGTQLARWTIDQRLGAGGFGVVYAAHDGGERVALKVLHPELASSPQAVRRFEREIDVLQRLEHPNMVRIIERGRSTDGRPYFAMELLEGTDLAGRIAVRGRMDPGEALAILEPVCDALSEAHASSVFHRDIKASNVFVTTDGRVLLLDFGVAKLADDAQPGLTTSWQVLGTPAYRAPEQIGRTADARSDVYALGALLFELVTGRAPFSGASATVVQHLHRHARRPRASLLANVPAAVDEVIGRAMSVDPVDRHSTPAKLASEFRAAVERSGHTGSRSRPAGDRLRGIAVRVNVATRQRWRGIDDPEILEETGRILVAASRWLGEDGFETVVSGSQTVVMVALLQPEPGLDNRLRNAVERTASDLEEAAEGRRLLVEVTVHDDIAHVTGGRITGGPLFDFGAWPTLADETVARPRNATEHS